MDRRQQGRCALPVRVHTDTGAHQHSRDPDISLLRGKQHRRESTLGPGPNVCAAFNQQADNFVVVLGRGPHQRGLPAPDGLGVDVCAVVQEHPDDVHLAR